MSAVGEGLALSVVVPTRNRAPRLARLLESLERQSLDAARFEVVVVDDGSTDGTPELLAERAEEARLPLKVLRQTGAGPAAARNAGWHATSAPLVAFTDDDCEPDVDWLERTLVAATEHPGAIIQGPTTPIPGEIDRTGPFTRTKLIVEPGPWFQTCNIAYPRKALESLGGFDEAFSEPHGEDTDLAWRARRLGVETIWREDVRVRHAVDDVGARGFLRDALRGVDTIAIFRRHPPLRAEALRWGTVRNPRLPWLGLALAGLWIARRSALLGALLTLPYARHVAGICRMQRASFLLAPYYALWDLLFAYTALRGSIRHRTLVL